MHTHQCTLRKGTQDSSRNVRHAGKSDRQPSASRQQGQGGEQLFMVTGAMRLWEGTGNSEGSQTPSHPNPRASRQPHTLGTKRVPLTQAGCHTQGKNSVELSARNHNVP